MNVNFTPQALSDLQKIGTYISEYDEAAASRVVSRIRQSIMMFESFPLLGRSGSVGGTGEFSIPGLPYIVVYQIASATELDVLTIVHDRMQYPPLA